MRMTIAYDGSDFYGFAYNEGVPTVSGSLEEALSKVLGCGITLSCAGRTDRGVHARRQLVSFDAPKDRVDVARLAKSINRMCGPRIMVSDVAVVDDTFHARFSCVERVYRYRILNAAVADPLSVPFSWHVEHPLNMNAIRVASDRLLGTHDFSSFCRRKRPDQSLVRTVRKAMWRQEDDFFIFEIAARAFCHQMVRSIVALLVAVGLGRVKASDVGEIIAARDRSLVPSPAPAQGLILWDALYERQELPTHLGDGLT